MHIQEAAKILHTTPKAIRYYEKQDLISPQKEADNAYRIFTEADLMRLSTILALREIDMSINDIRQLLADETMDMTQYLNIQRSALFERWLALKDMIQTIDQMIDRTEAEDYTVADIHELAVHLKDIKNKRVNWQDRWNFNEQGKDYDNHIKLHGHRFNVHQDYHQALQMVADTVQLEPGQTCLDIGIGTGNLGSLFLEKDIRVIGVDQAENMLEVCKQKHPEIDVRKDIFLRCLCSTSK
ncbi:MerR family transcriptional regulator [Virgibacillus sp. 179-BFC.A HS]|uniref:MerR family transcriptional regulator n=1 Tax=Tigheibacillus jepli TaxID=3035914 RepID=A0ABU5CCK4_9BACI|nr:MerR family transcriptional regulator [Virgibacillus sp. 179-BFC.A HS]MDY0404058.1 MerR family transcriptional regulator [Virgibacillus sp. 179-BFC.A HS]